VPQEERSPSMYAAKMMYKCKEEFEPDTNLAASVTKELTSLKAQWLHINA
jgi:hypothetical protein